MRGGDLGFTHRRSPRCPSRAAALAITLASNVIAVVTASAGSCSTVGAGGAGSGSGDRGRDRVWYQTELDRLHGSPPCTVTSLQPVPLRSSRRPGRLTSSHTCSRSASDPSVATDARTVHAGRLGVGPRRRDQRLAAVGQHQQQLHRPVPAHPAQHPQRPALQRMAHRVILTADGRSSRPVVRRGFVRRDRPHGPDGPGAAADQGQARAGAGEGASRRRCRSTTRRVPSTAGSRACGTVS